MKFSLEDVEKAAIQISNEILTTSSAYIAPMLTSMENHLCLRSERLRGLAEHLRSTYGSISSTTRWRLLQDAEKLEAARGIWINYDNRNLQEHSEGEILSNIIMQYMLEASDAHESDCVRVWFHKYVPEVARLMRFAQLALMDKSARGRIERLALAVAGSEANEIVLSGLQAAFDFRVNSAGLYGFDGLIDEKGILIDAQAFPEPWTSPPDLLHAIDEQHQHSIRLIKGLWGPNMDKGRDTIEKIATQIEELAELLCRVFLERIGWYERQSQIDDELNSMAQDVRERYEKQRGEWVRPLVSLGRTDAAYAIAERYQDFWSLVELASVELIQADTTVHEGLDEDQRLTLSQQRVDIVKRLDGYFERFRAPFAIEFYKYLIDNGKFQELLEEFQGYRSYLTKFLHSSDELSKLAWIHDASLGQYDRAGDTLVHIAVNQEDNIWSKKVELSIGKLCKVAGLRSKESEALEYYSTWQDEAFTIIQIQEQVSEYLQPYVRGVGDCDEKVITAMKEKGKSVSKQLAMKDIAKEALNRIFNMKVMEPEPLIDLLTLMDRDDNFPRFYLALVALKKSGLDGERFFLAEQSIWRRCYIQDELGEPYVYRGDVY